MYLPENKNVLKKEYYSWLKNNQQHHKSVISSAIDSIYNINRNTFSDEDLNALEEGLKLSYLFSYPLGEYAFNFAKRHKNIEQLLLRLANHSTAKVRMNLITLCLMNEPVELVDEILSRGLNDKSKACRLKTADIIERLSKKKFSQKLLARVEIESDLDVKKMLQWTNDLITKNWSLVNVVGDGFENRVTVQLRQGGVTGFILEHDEDRENLALIEKKVRGIRIENECLGL